MTMRVSRIGELRAKWESFLIFTFSLYDVGASDTSACTYINQTGNISALP